MRKTFFILSLLFLPAFTGFAWGKLGHQIIVEVAKRHLSEKAREGIAAYMPYDITIDAGWMDKHRSDPELLYMYHFHEQCINLETLEYDPNSQVEKGDMMHGLCIARYNLSHREHLSDSVVVLNIRMLIHFMGDLHCPVHLGIPGIWFPKPPYRQDLGKWYFQGKAYKSFHAFLDGAPAMLWPGLTPSEAAATIDKDITRSKSRAWTKGGFVEWTNDAARRGYRIYNFQKPLWEIPDTPEPKYIDDRFLDDSRDILTEEILKAGYQLASVLNRCFGDGSR